MRILVTLATAACLTAIPAVAQYNTPQQNGQQNGQYDQNHRNDQDQNHRYDGQNRYDQNQNQNPNGRARSEENRQENSSNINDAVNIVNGPRLRDVTPRSAWLDWSTNHVAASRVRYGTNPQNPEQHAYESGGTRDHHVELNNLQPGRTYYYEIETRGGKDRFKGSFHTPRG
jgi:hypothetical protein